MAATATATPPGVVDPTKPAKYPVILSDALLGKSPKEILTAIRYNHRPTLSTDTAPGAARLKPTSASSSSSSSGSDSYGLTYTDDGGKYAYSGSRSTKDNQYVLIFDPERKAFVLHRVDSTFDMNLTRTPSNSDAASLREEYPHLEGSMKASAQDKKGPGAGGKAGKGKNAARSAGMVQSRRSAPAPAQAPAPAAAASREKQEPAPKSKPKRAPSPVDSDEENSDDDGGLLVEYPDPQPSAVRPAPAARDAVPFPTAVRRFSEFIAGQAGSGGESDEDADADAEYDEDEFLIEDEAGESTAGDGFKLGSPLGRQGGAVAHEPANDIDEEEPPEAELMAMLEQEMDEDEGMDVDSESSVSEED